MQPDPEIAGVFMVAEKPTDWMEVNIDGVELYSIISGRRMLTSPIDSGLRLAVTGIMMGNRARSYLPYFIQRRIISRFSI